MYKAPTRTHIRTQTFPKTAARQEHESIKNPPTPWGPRRGRWLRCSSTCSTLLHLFVSYLSSQLHILGARSSLNLAPTPPHPRKTIGSLAPTGATHANSTVLPSSMHGKRETKPEAVLDHPIQHKSIPKSFFGKIDREPLRTKAGISIDAYMYTVEAGPRLARPVASIWLRPCRGRHPPDRIATRSFGLGVQPHWAAGAPLGEPSPYRGTSTPLSNPAKPKRNKKPKANALENKARTKSRNASKFARRDL